MLDAVAQNIDDTALADLALQPGEEFLPRRTVVVEVERRHQGRLGAPQEGAQLERDRRPGPVIGLRIAEQPVVQADEGFAVARRIRRRDPRRLAARSCRRR